MMREFFAWWFGQLAELLPQGLRRTALTAVGAKDLAELPRVTGRTTVLRLGGPDVLGKTLTLPLAAERELDQVLGFEMDRETPFKAEEIYWNHRIEGSDRQNG